MSLENLIIRSIMIFLLAFCLISLCGGRLTSEIFGELSNKSSSSSHGATNGTKWALLVAGSNEYENYRHQADICHAYHIMKQGGIKDENIIVFMYDDIAYNEENPRPGVIINRPFGPNLYPGVPKDYIGKAVNSSNFYAAILGNKTAIKGGSGKVLETGPNDHIFIYYADHGGAGILGMPRYEDMVYAKDFINVLKKKHASKSYKSMVIYIEACESGSIFDGLLPKNLNIYAVTAANTEESSYATYCPDDTPVYPKEYNYTCFGDVFSVSWLEDSDKENPTNETLEQQYVEVRNRTSGAKEESSHVMQYGDLKLTKELRAVYMAANSGKGNHTLLRAESGETPLIAVDQRDVELFYLKAKVQRAPLGSNERADAQRKLEEVLSHRKHVDESVEAIGEALFGEANAPALLRSVRPAGQVLVDDWECLKTMVTTYEAHCGPLKTSGKKHMRGLANLCNAGVNKDQMSQASAQACAAKLLNI